MDKLLLMTWLIWMIKNERDEGLREFDLLAMLRRNCYLKSIGEKNRVE